MLHRERQIMAMTQNRIEWIDGARFVAVTAVTLDHCGGFLYTNQLISYATHYSVGLFVLLAGISIWTAYSQGKEISYERQFNKVKSIFYAYALATLIVLCIERHQFDLKTYLRYLVSFNIQAPYYYIVFFIQLLMSAPILVGWCRFVNSKKQKWILHIGSLCALGLLAYISINFTYILPVYGGGQFLGGVLM